MDPPLAAANRIIRYYERSNLLRLIPRVSCNLTTICPQGLYHREILLDVYTPVDTNCLQLNLMTIESWVCLQ